MLDFYIFLPVETERNTVQFSHLMAWWRHNSVTMHVTKVYFIQLVIKIKYVDFEDNTKHFFIKKTWECETFTDRRLIKEVATKKLANTNTGRLSAKFVNERSIERIVMTDFKMCCLYVVLVLPGSVEAQLGWSGKFY